MSILKAIYVFAFSSVALSTPLGLDKRQCVDTCGSTCYYQSDINEAVNKGCNYLRNGQQVGSQDYPHVYNNREGFDFPDSGTYYEFPILKSYQAYSGGSPGPDRVIFTGSGCKFEAVITHTGASGNDFLQCRG